MLTIPTRAEIEAEQCRRSFGLFVRYAWPLVEPANPFVDGYHVEAITERLEGVVRGEIRKLLINLPPRCGKSTLLSVLFPAWIWTLTPETRFLFASYAEPLATRDSRRCRAVIESAWYRERFGHLFQLSSDANLQHRFENDHTGVRLATSVGGSATGEGGDFIIIDDPHKAEESHSSGAREREIEWYGSTIATRRNNPATGSIIVIGQRIHERDLHGHLIAQGDWVSLVPADGIRATHPFLWPDDPRTQPGELLWPGRFGRGEVEELKRDLGSSRRRDSYNSVPRRPAAASSKGRGGGTTIPAPCPASTRSHNPGISRAGPPRRTGGIRG